jgi:hypothetical protein
MYVIAFFQTLPPCLVGVHHRHSSRSHRNASLTIQSAFVRPDSFPQNSEDCRQQPCPCGRNDAQAHDSLSFDAGSDLFSYHTADFVLPASASCSKPHEAKSNDILSVQPKLDRLVGQSEPRLEHGTPNFGG